MISSGTSPFVRWTCSARGAITLRAKEPNVSATISMSPSRCRGPGRSASAARNSGSRNADERVGLAEGVALDAPLRLRAR